MDLGSLEVFNLTTTVFCLSREVVKRSRLAFQPAFDDVKHGYELGEDEHLVSFLMELIQEIEESVHFRGFFLQIFRVDQTWVTANLS